MLIFKSKSFIIIIISFVLSLLFLVGCDLLNKNDEQPVITNATVRDAYEKVVEAHAVKQVVLYNIVSVYSNNYQTGQLFSYEPTYEELDTLLSQISALNEYKENIDYAVSIINSTEQNQKLRIYKGMSTYHPDGIGSAISGFWGYLSGSAKRNRDRIKTITSHMNSGEKTKLYNSLRSNWKNQTTSESDFWNKLDKGEFDNQAGQMYNDFYHDADTDFPYLAQDKDLTPAKVVVREGAEGIKKGAELLIETTKIVTPLGKGMDLAEKGKEFVDNIEKAVDKPKEFIKDVIKDKIADKIGSYVDVDGLIDGAELGENTGEAVKILLDAFAGSDDPADWVKDAMDWGATKIMDSDTKGSKADIVIADKVDDDGENPQVIIGVGESDDEQGGIDVALPSGEWIFTALDNLGNVDNVVTEIIDNVFTILITSTDPEETQENSQYSLSAWVSPGNPAEYQSVTVYAKIYPIQAGIEIYFSISGSDGYSNAETVQTNDEGQASFYVPGAESGVSDNITVRIVSTGLTRTLSYVF